MLLIFLLCCLNYQPNCSSDTPASTVLALFEALAQNQYLTAFELEIEDCPDLVKTQIAAILENNYIVQQLAYRTKHLACELFAEIIIRNKYLASQQRFKSMKAITQH